MTIRAVTTISGLHWRVSHDGTVWEPATSYYNTPDPEIDIDPLGSDSNSCIKNSGLSPLSPELGEPNHTPKDEA